MTSSSMAFTLLAQQQTLAQASEHFRQTKSTFDWGDLIVGMAFLLVVLLGIFLLKKLLERSERQTGYRHSGKLFAELCAAHELDQRERRLLRRLAANEQLEDPGRMFVEPERMDVSRIPESLASRRNEVFALRDRLFAGNSEGEVSWLAPQVTAAKPEPRDAAEDDAAILS